MRTLYLTGFDGAGTHLNPYRPKFSDGAEAIGLMSPRMRDLCLAAVVSSDAQFNQQLLGDVDGDPGSVLITSVARDQDLDQSASSVIPEVSARLERSGIPGDFLVRNAGFLTYRQVGLVIGSLVQFYQRYYGMTHESLVERLLTQGKGATDAIKIQSALDTDWSSLVVTNRDALADTWKSLRKLPRRDFNARFSGLPLRKLFYDAADQFDEVSMAVGINFAVPMAKNIGRMYTYGQNRSQLFSDTFDSSIDSNWDNPPENSTSMQWVSGGYIESSTGGFTACGIRRNAESFNTNQYCVATIQTHTATKYVAALARIQPTSGQDDNYTFACWDSGPQNNHLRLVEGGSITTLASDNSPSDPLAAGETITIEVEGSTIRGGYNRGAGDAQWGADQTDSTHTGGRPGVVTVTDTVADTQITSVLGGNIGSTTLTGSGTPAAQDSTLAGTAERVLPGSGTPASQAATLSGTAERVLPSSGALTAQAVVIAGTATLQLKLLLTAAVGRELRDENGALVASLSNIVYEWYEKDTDTDGDPDQSGTFSTDASGEATIQLPGTGLSSGQYGTLILRHPTDSAIWGIYRVPVT